MGNTSGKVKNNNVPKEPQAKQPDSSVQFTLNEKIEWDRLCLRILRNNPPRKIRDCRAVFKNQDQITRL